MRSLKILFVGCLVAIPAPESRAEVQAWQVRSETVYSTGNYGSDVESEVLYAPLEIRRIFGWGEVGVAIPYLWYRSKGTYTYTDLTSGPRLQTIPISGKAEGIYDLLFDAKYRVLAQEGNQPEILLRGYWKPPTGNEAEGLGSGAHDWLVGAEFWGWLPDSQRWFYFGDAYRYFSGGTPSEKGYDSWIYEIGIGHSITSDLEAKLSYKEQSALAPALPSARLINLETKFKLNPNFKLLSGFYLGTSDAAPDWCMMLGFEASF